jgi:hypothetical protein
MTDQSLAQAVNRFAGITQSLPDADLERAWAWRAYTSEGIRFAFFRTLEELRELAVLLNQERLRQGKPVTKAQRILGYYHAAYADLNGALIGLEDEKYEQAPAAGEWPLRKTLGHIVAADLGFYVITRYALERACGPENRPSEISDADWERISGLDEAAFNAVMQGSVENLRAYFNDIHRRTLAEFADIIDAELEQPSVYWENEPLSIQFRLHRFESHLRQHTIQVDKTLAATQPAPNEARRLLRMLFSAQADVESQQMGAPEVGEAAMLELAKTIEARCDEIAAILAA